MSFLISYLFTVEFIWLQVLYSPYCKSFNHGYYSLLNNIHALIKVVTPIDAIVTAATGVKKRLRGQRLFLVTVKRSRTIFKLSEMVKMQFWMIKLHQER